MRAVVTDITTLSSRGEIIRVLLRPLVGHPSAPYCDTLKPTGAFIIGTHEGSPTTSEYRDWRFGTFVTGFRAMYFELWRPVNERRVEYYLDRSYLSIFRYKDRDSSDEQEFLCLHCDPNEPEDADHVRYKRVPHLHIIAAETPFPHAHLALLVGQSEDLLLTSDGWSNALGAAIEMLREEVMNPLAKIHNPQRN